MMLVPLYRSLGLCVALGAALFDPLGQAQERPLEPPADTLPPTWNLEVLPLGISKLAQHAEHPEPNELQIQLGRRLFFDPILSGDGSMACASCHRPDHGFASEQPVAIGVGGERGHRNAPTLLNRALGEYFFWDGRAATLEEQSLQPIENPKEMASQVDQALARLRAEPTYQAQFQAAFVSPDASGNATDPITADNLARALASFERMLVVGNSPVDQFRAARYESLTSRQRAGLWIFESRGKCWQCHSGDNLSDEQFHNTGISFGNPDRDLGRYSVTKLEPDRFAMKTPTLRAVAQTAPYMHDGSMKTLREVVEFYNRGGSPQDPLLDRRLKPLELTETELDALADFLQALSPIDPFGR